MRFAASALGVLLAATLGASPSPAPQAASLDALLARAREASGAPYRVHVVSRSKAEIDGRTFDEITETEGLKYLARRCLRDVCTGFFFDGDRSYAVDLNDTPLPLERGNDPVQRTLRAIASYAFTDPSFVAGGGVLARRPDVVESGEAFPRIAVAAPQGAMLDAVLDPHDGLVVGVVSREHKLAFTFRDQRRVSQQLRLPFSVVANGREIEHFDERTVEADPLHTPTGMTPAIAGGVTTVAMRPPNPKSDQPVVPCRIGAHNALCLLDTGASGLSISLELAESLGLEPTGAAFDVTGLGQYVTGLVKAPELTIGTATFPSARFVVLHDLAQYGYDAVLGTDIFARARVTLDYGARRVTIATGAPAASVASVPLAFEDFVPVASLGLGSLDVPLVVDSGDESAIDLAQDFYATHDTLFTPTATTSVGGIGGRADQVTGEVSGVRFGAFMVARSPIAATKKLSTTAHGHIGSGLLAHFSATFDYERERLELIPRAGDASIAPVPAASPN